MEEDMVLTVQMSSDMRLKHGKFSTYMRKINMQ